MSNGRGLNWQNAIVVIAIVLTIIQGGIWAWYVSPMLDQRGRAAKTAADSLLTSRQQLELTRRQLDEVVSQRDQHLKTIDDLRQKWQLARNNFIASLDQDIRDALSTQPQPQPQPSVVQIAQKLVADRDAVRRQLLQIEDDVQHIYDRLDSDIDGIRSRLSRPPTTDDEMRDLIRQLAVHWNDKVHDVNEAAEDLLLLLSCPHAVASNP
jgi:hypothetical protein